MGTGVPEGRLGPDSPKSKNPPSDVTPTLDDTVICGEWVHVRFGKGGLSSESRVKGQWLSSDPSPTTEGGRKGETGSSVSSRWVSRAQC